MNLIVRAIMIVAAITVFMVVVVAPHISNQTCHTYIVKSAKYHYGLRCQ